MAHILAPQPPNQYVPVFFNVDGVVGEAPAQNKREDVLLVQFCMKATGHLMSSKNPAALIAAIKAVQVTGTVDAATITAIRFVQEHVKTTVNPGQIVDGRVSPSRGGYSFGVACWTIVQLNSQLQKYNVDVWPRIDKIAGCPAELKQMVVRTVAGVR